MPRGEDHTRDIEGGDIMTLTGEIIKMTVLSGDIGAVSPPSPPVPARGDHYTGEISDVGHSIYMTVNTMEKEDID